MIYIASPYSSNPDAMGERAAKARSFVAFLTKRGLVVYSPITHFHSAAVAHNLPREFDFWQKINYHMIDRADELYVLRLRGWEESKGVQGEIKYALDRGIPVHPWHETRYASFEPLHG